MNTSIKKINQSYPKQKTFLFCEIRETETLEIIKSLLKNKAIVFKDIRMRIIKDAAHVYSHRLTLIFNNYIRNGKFPDTLKYTDITQVFKKVDTTDKSNYRPISILPNFSKIFEKIIYNQVNSYTAQDMKFSIKDFFSKYGQIRRELQIWSHLLKKSLMENFIFCAVIHGA